MSGRLERRLSEHWLRRRVRRGVRPGGGLELTKTYGFRGADTHNWSPYWNTALYGARAAVNYSGTAKGLICGSAAFAHPDRHLQPGLQHRPGRWHHPLDAGEEPDLLGRLDLQPPRPEVLGATTTGSAEVLLPLAVINAEQDSARPTGQSEAWKSMACADGEDEPPVIERRSD